MARKLDKWSQYFQDILEREEKRERGEFADYKISNPVSSENLYREKHRTQVKCIRGNHITARRELQQFYDDNMDNPYFTVYNENIVPIPRGVAIYVTYRE